MPINTTNILSSLKSIDAKFSTETDPFELHLLAKLSILEACGWIEESFDNIILPYSSKYLNPTYQKRYEDNFLKPNYGFSWSQNIENRLLIGIFGLVKIQKLELTMDSIKLQGLKSELGTLRNLRNILAHTHTDISILPRTEAPSVIIGRVRRIEAYLKEFEKKLLKIKFK